MRPVLWTRTQALGLFVPQELHKQANVGWGMGLGGGKCVALKALTVTPGMSELTATRCLQDSLNKTSSLRELNTFSILEASGFPILTHLILVPVT